MPTRRVLVPLVTAGLAAVLLLPRLGGSAQATQDPDPPPDQMPRFTPSGALLRPEGWDAWVMVGASTGLSYNEPRRPPTAGESPGMFHNVYMQPWAYRKFLETGAFPQGMMLVLAFFESSRKATPARAGFYEGDRLPVYEVHLKWDGVDKTGWGFYNFADTTTSAAMIPGTASCYSCHATEAAHDHVFTQFYPALRARLARTSP